MKLFGGLAQGPEAKSTSRFRQQQQSHQVITKTMELNRPIYYKNVLTSEEKPAKVLLWACGFAYISTKKWNAVDIIKTDKDYNWAREVLAH